MNELVFVYGILLRDAEALARLDGYRLEYYGHATVTEAPGEFVMGGVVSVDDDRLAMFDRIEGVRIGHPDEYYRRVRVTVKVNGQPVEAWVYVMNEKWRKGRDEFDWLDTRREQELRRLSMSAIGTTMTRPA